MTDTPDKPTPLDDEANRDDALVDAVVSDDTSTPEPATTDAPEPEKKLSRKERKLQDKLHHQQERAKYGWYPSYLYHSTIDSVRQSIKEHGSVRAWLWHAWVKPIGTVFILVALLRSTIIDWNDVPSGSMEPTILVGDRILVNKMAYALQVPLSGPKIGVPFTPLQWDNPLDGIPSWHWGTPVRGDIVTFWNPATGVRMVKRIVAQPGDTLELRGGIMTITPRDGTPTTATYIDNTPAPPHNLTIVGQNARGGDIKKEAERREETLLGEVRTIQHIPERWIADWALYRFADGRELVAVGGRVNVPDRGRVPVEAFLEELGQPTLRLAIRDGAPLLNGEEISYNTFADAYLAPFAAGPAAAFGQVEVHAEQGQWLIDGEPASSEQLQTLFAGMDLIATRNGQTLAIPTDAQREVLSRHTLLRSLMTSSFGPVTLGDDAFYMIGDNRNNSTDSRYFGPVQRSEITGEAVAIPVSFHGKMRELRPNWSRWFHGLD